MNVLDTIKSWKFFFWNRMSTSIMSNFHKNKIISVFQSCNWLFLGNVLSGPHYNGSCGKKTVFLIIKYNFFEILLIISFLIEKNHHIKWEYKIHSSRKNLQSWHFFEQLFQKSFLKYIFIFWHSLNWILNFVCLSSKPLWWIK